MTPVPLPLPCKLSPTTSAQIALNILTFRGGDAEDRLGVTPRMKERALTLEYPNLGADDARVVEDALRGSRGVRRFSYTHKGVESCYRASKGYSVEYEKLGATIKVELEQVICPHVVGILPSTIHWDDTVTLWDSGEGWDV